MPVLRTPEVERLLTPDPKADREPDVAQANVEAAHALAGSPAYFPFRGRVYGIPPISVPVGLMLTDVLKRYNAAMESEDGGDEAEVLALYHKGIRIFHRYARPRSIRAVVPWFLRRNEFRKSSLREFYEILLFFLASQMRSSIRFQSGPKLVTPSST